MRSLMCVKAKTRWFFLTTGAWCGCRALCFFCFTGCSDLQWYAMVWFAVIRPRWIKGKIVVVVFAASVIRVYTVFFLVLLCSFLLLVTDAVSVNQTCLEPSDRYIMSAFWSSRRISMRHPTSLGHWTPTRVEKGKLQWKMQSQRLYVSLSSNR